MRLMDTTAGRWVMVVMMFLVASSGLLFAQELVAPVPVVTAPQLTSVGAVVAATMFATMMLKKFLVDVPVLSNVPIWVYVCLIAIGLTYVANQILGTLPGNFGLLAWDAIYNAAAASGVREWVEAGVGKPLAAAGENRT